MSKTILVSWWDVYFRPQDFVIEVYQCKFCDFEESKLDIMPDHYYFNHMEEVNNMPITRTDKIDYIIINGPKSFVSSRLE